MISEAAFKIVAGGIIVHWMFNQKTKTNKQHFLLDEFYFKHNKSKKYRG
jgi:hypothetical protein